MLAGQAHAGQAVTNDDYFDLSLTELTAITVTSAFPESHLTATSSVAVVNADYWQTQGARRPADIMATLPSTMTYTSLGAHAIAIRGFANSTAAARGIATLLDGVPLNGYAFGSALYSRLQWQLESLSQIQVIRGPSSALYGSDAFHGVIALQGYRGNGDEQTVSAQLGSDLYWRSAWNSSVSLGDGWRLDSSIGVAEKPDEDRRYRYTDPVTGDAASGEYDYRDNSQSLMARLQSPQLDSGNYGSGDYGIGVYSNRYTADNHPGMGQSFSPGISRSMDRDHADGDTFFDMIKADARWQLAADSALSLQTYTWRSGLDTWLDLLGQVQQSIQLTRTNESRNGIELTLKQRLPANTDWQLGASYDRLRIDDRLTRYVAGDGTVLQEYSENSDNAARHMRGLVSQFKTRLADDKLTLVYGGRFDEFSDVGSKLTPRAGAIFNIDREQAVKLLYGRAFRAPVAVEQYGIAVARGNRNLKPETIDTVELVYMYQADNWRTELVGFSSDWDNGIVLAGCISNCGSQYLEYQNVNESESHGVELITEAVVGRWKLRETITYTDSRSNSGVAGSAQQASMSQHHYSAFPRWLAHLDVGYHFSNDIELYLSNHIAHDFTAGVGGSAASREQLDTYYRCDLHLTKTLYTSTDLALHVSNLFDHSNWQPSLWNTENGLEDIGRIVSIAASHRF